VEKIHYLVCQWMPASMPMEIIFNGLYSYTQNNPQTGFIWRILITVITVPRKLDYVKYAWIKPTVKLQSSEQKLQQPSGRSSGIKQSKDFSQWPSSFHLLKRSTFFVSKSHAGKYLSAAFSLHKLLFTL
jgi:hypothetical protein